MVEMNNAKAFGQGVESQRELRNLGGASSLLIYQNHAVCLCVRADARNEA